MKVNQAAELSAQVRMPYMVFLGASALVSKASLDPFRHTWLLATGVAESLLYAAAHDFTCAGTSLAAGAVSAAVNLIGRNESGLTLSREAADSVMRDFKTYFVPNTRRGQYPPKRPMHVAKAIVNMVISDTNKAFVVEHNGAVDVLVAGLLLDEGDPRRSQQAGDELQATCALALQNLALSDVGKAALRSHVDVMDGLRRLSSSSGDGDSVGMTVEARQYASGALFELDESARHPIEQGDGGRGEAVEHIMLSYNWDHQSTIKRVNASLQSRGYAV